MRLEQSRSLERLTFDGAIIKVGKRARLNLWGPEVPGLVAPVCHGQCLRETLDAGLQMNHKRARRFSMEILRIKLHVPVR